MKKKIECMSREDWEKMGACTKDMYLKSMSLLGLCSRNFGKTNHAAQRAKRIYELMRDLKSEIHSMAGSNARDFFSDEEIDHLFYGD